MFPRLARPALAGGRRAAHDPGDAARCAPTYCACPLYYPQKSAEPAPTKRLRAFLGTEAALGAAVAATAWVAALFMRALLIATSTHAIYVLLGVSSLMRNVRTFFTPGTRMCARYGG